MRSFEVLREAIDKVGVKAVAAELRVSSALIYKWCEETDPNDPDASGARNPLDRLRDIVRLTGHVPVVNWLCHEAGGFFAHNPPAKASNLTRELLESTQRLVHGFSALLDDVSRSAANDGQIALDEAGRIRDDWERLKTTAESFVVACEKGTFQRTA